MLVISLVLIIFGFCSSNWYLDPQNEVIKSTNPKKDTIKVDVAVAMLFNLMFNSKFKLKHKRSKNGGNWWGRVQKKAKKDQK
jgi:hypothetical protein